MGAEIQSMAPKWTWRSLVFAAGGTLLLFGVLPVLEKLDPPEMEVLKVRELQTVSLPLPPEPPPELREPEPRLQEPEMEMNLPEIAPPADPVQPQSIPVDLAVGIGDVAANFHSDFSVMDPNLTSGMAKTLFEIAELDQGLRPVVQMRPQYPPQARMRRLEGHVSVEYIVGVDGKVRDVRVIESTPEGVFDRVTERAVARWTFRPGRKNGVAVATRVRQRIDFTLD
jgi:protein TonB